MKSAPSNLSLPSLRLLVPNRWDIVLLPLVIVTLFLFAWGVQQMAVPFVPGKPLPLSLDPANLPGYAMRTSLRMALAMLASLLFTFLFGGLAAKSARAEKLLIPLLDILQSVPILGFMSITVVGFLKLFPGSLLGPEFAAVFAIFTSQAWNMAFSYYASLRMIPADLIEATTLMRLSRWQRFWRLEAPFAMPGLVWNAMMSVAGGWFFVVASEAISVEGYDIDLPGIGSYIALAIQQRELHAIGWAILTMLIVIWLSDQLVFRPLVAWAEKFRFEFSQGEAPPRSWVLDAWRRARLTPQVLNLLGAFQGLTESLRLQLRRMPRRALRSLHVRPLRPLRPLRRRAGRFAQHGERIIDRLLDRYWSLLLIVFSVLATVTLVRFVRSEVGFDEIGEVFLLGLATGARVVILIVLASLVWVPVGVWIGLHPLWSQRTQPLVVFLAAFPANLVFPLAVSAIVTWQLNPEIWLSPLMILGTQWYILFNVIGGASALPADLKEAAASLGLSRMQLWRRLWLPAVFPSFVTGGLTASGGAWNASVVAEVASWGTTTLKASGIGAYIAEQTTAGDHPRIVLGVAVMSLYVVLINRTLWERLYLLARRRFTFV